MRSGRCSPTAESRILNLGVKMQDWMKMQLRMFIENYWDAFKAHCADGGDEKQADEIYQALGGEPE